MRGFTLLEVLGTLVVSSVLAVTALPRLTTLHHRMAVDHEAARLIATYHRARARALHAQRPVVLRVRSDTISAWMLESGDSSLAWAEEGVARTGVTLVLGIPRVVFLPTGVTLGVANGRWVLARGGATRTVVASRPGRLRVERP